VVKSYATLCNAHANAASQQMLQEVEKPNGCERPQPTSGAGYNNGIFYDEWQGHARFKGKRDQAVIRAVSRARPQPDRVSRTSRHRKYVTRCGVLASVDARLLASTLQA
jgi:hypothetical protein